MTAMGAAQRVRTGTTNRVKRTLLIITAIALAPIVASYGAYYFWPRDAQLNYGELLATKPAPSIDGVRADGQPFRLEQLRGRWAIVMPLRGPCGLACERMLYATRQARTIQGKDMDRVRRVLVKRGEDAVPEALVAQHPELDVVDVTPSAFADLPISDGRIYLIDPLGNLVLAWPADPDIKALAKDLGRVLRASQIG